MKKTVLAVAAVLAIAACSSGSSEDTTTTAPAEPTTTEAPAEPTTTEAVSADVVGLADTSLGQVLVDEAGNTLYIFTADTDGTSTCYDSCDANWPFVPSGLAVGDGVSATLGETIRDGGQGQLTVNGRPVYLFAGDSGPGDVNGQSVGGVWFVIGADGEPIGA